MHNLDKELEVQKALGTAQKYSVWFWYDDAQSKLEKGTSLFYFKTFAISPDHLVALLRRREAPREPIIGAQGE